jgi:hypothetical protein
MRVKLGKQKETKILFANFVMEKKSKKHQKSQKRFPALWNYN